MLAFKSASLMKSQKLFNRCHKGALDMEANIPEPTLSGGLRLDLEVHATKLLHEPRPDLMPQPFGGPELAKQANCLGLRTYAYPRLECSSVVSLFSVWGL